MYRSMDLVLSGFVAVMAGVSLILTASQWRKEPKRFSPWAKWWGLLAFLLFLTGILGIVGVVIERDVTWLHLGLSVLMLVPSLMLLVSFRRLK